MFSLFSFKNKINELKSNIRLLNENIHKEYYQSDYNNNLLESESLLEKEISIPVEESENSPLLDDSDIKLNKSPKQNHRNYALDQFIRKRDYIQKKIKQKKEDRMKYSVVYEKIDNMDDFMNEQTENLFKKNWRSLDIWQKKNRLFEYINRYWKDTIDSKDTDGNKDGNDKEKEDKFIILLEKKLNRKSKEYIDNMIVKLEKNIKYDKKEGIIKTIKC